MARAECAGQKAADCRFAFRAVQIGERDRHIMGTEFGQFLPAATAGRDRIGAVGDHIHRDNVRAPAAIIAAMAPASAQVPSG